MILVDIHFICKVRESVNLNVKYSIRQVTNILEEFGHRMIGINSF